MKMFVGNDLPARSVGGPRLEASLDNSGADTAPKNALATEPSPTAADQFARAALSREEIVGAASGIFDGQLYIWLFLETMDIAATKALFDLQATFEHRHQGTFELHVDALQGRPLADALPHGFRLLTYR